MSRIPSREEALFADALARPAAERASFLNAACADDAGLYERILALLAAHAGAESLVVGSPVPKPDGDLRLHLSAVSFHEEKPGEAIGRYKLLQKIGEGGCGVVWMAEQEEPVRRRVALKIIKLGMDTRSVIARFEAERQALALMDHPNIARVLDAGSTDTGRPYFVMELVRGVRLTTYCDQQKLPIRERLDLFIKVCQAIQHAHQKGIIHRDIKPSNILVTLHDGVPVPKVIDFGIAKATDQRLTDKTLFTQYDAFIGTPAYMSPEQAEMSGLDVDTRTDIYSLGVLLYELLIGVTPFDAQTLAKSGLDEMRRIIREHEPKRPSTRLGTLETTEATTVTTLRREKLPALSVLLRGDLDWIVMKCLEKDRTRRYESASGLAADLRRHLSNEAIAARPPSSLYRLQKAFRRNRLVYTAVAAVAVALIAGIVIASRQAVRARNAESATHDELENARAALAFIRDDLLGQASPDRQPDPNLTVRAMLDLTSTQLDQSRKLPAKVEAAVRQMMGTVYFERGEYAPAIDHLEKALALQRERLGESNEDTLRTRHVLSETLWWSGDDIKCLKLAQEGWELSRRALGETNELTLQFRADVAGASIYTDPEPMEEMERQTKDALQVVRRTLGESDKLTFRLKIILGGVYSERGKFLEAETELTEAIEQYRASLPENNPLMLRARAWLGRFYAARAYYEKAEALYDQAEALDRRVIELCRRILGPDHAMTVNAEISLAMVHLLRGEDAKADEIRTRVLKLLADDRLVESRLTGRGLVAFARLYRLLGQGEHVAELASAVLAAGQRQFRDEARPNHVMLLNDEWGRSLIEQERYAEAEPHFRRVMDVRDMIHGRRFASISRLGYCLFKQNKDLHQAESLLKHAAGELEKRFKQIPDYMRLDIVGGALHRLAEYYEATGRPTEAAVYRQKIAALEKSEGRKINLRDNPLF